MRRALLTAETANRAVLERGRVRLLQVTPHVPSAGWLYIVAMPCRQAVYWLSGEAFDPLVAYPASCDAKQIEGIDMPAAKFEHNNMHWMYLLALEEDLRTLARYVEFAPENLDVFSLECTRLLLAACSEVDTVMKLLAEPHINAASKTKKAHISMGDCRQTLFERHSAISTAMVSIPRYGLNCVPWASWAKKEQPKWWDAYTLVKHQRAKHYAQATLGNVLDAMAGLFVVLLVYLRASGVDIIMPATLLFRPHWQLGSYCISPEGHLIDLRPEYFRPVE